MDALIDPVVQELRTLGDNSTLSITYSASTVANCSSFYSSISGSNTAGGGGVSSSRLLGRKELVDIPQCELSQYLRRAVAAQNTTAGTYATVGLSGGLGATDAPAERWGALLPAWNTAHLHFFVGGASGSVDDVTSPQTLLADNAAWLEKNKEELWREWAPESGSYMNEGNPYNSHFKHDFYGDHYEGLLAVKQKYDPTESLYVLSGVGSDSWHYDLQDGTLCRTV
ncbi:Putative berberine/berberine, FAD-binding, type PCMH, subdomain 2 [Septoria linicola]|uniref:Berberine/berberine, FAD-binding, type PCMH, subdomain 2 n=1 Tax=Septoria linicola TaxID=215465 RepID=A0A9Q9EG22_9PEZI|nr:Putative berberine/berberine, FAD-binding, type PCMH, subdomain 2 [Septoria linicola]